MKKKVIKLSCIAAVAIATFVGTKTLQSNAYENGLLTQNVEALSNSEGQKVDCAVAYAYKHGSITRYCKTCLYVGSAAAKGKSKCKPWFSF